MKRTLFKLTLGLLLAWSLVATIRLPVAAQQTPTVTTMQNAAAATGNGTPLYVTGPAANPANVIGAAGIQVIGTFSGTVTFESTTDGSHWVEVLATNLSDNTQATTTTAAGQFTILLGSAVQVRARVSAYSSGTITVVGRLVPGLVARVTSSGGGGGSGDFVGPGSATDNAIVRFNGTTGKLGQNSVATIGDTGDMAGVANFTFTGVLTGGSGPTTITDSAGKILSAALNTVQPAQGGTGITALGTGVATFLGTPSSANLAAAVTGETGSGALVFGTSPDFTTGATIGGVAIPTISSANTLTNKTINGASNTLTVRIANDVSGLGTGVATALGVNTGSAGAVVLFNGAGGTPSSITLTNGTGLSLTTGVTGDLPFSSFVQAPSAGFVGATASGDYSHRTPTQVTAALDAMVGDSGSGGTKGLVPAPAAGDAAAGKFLKADGTWAVAGGSGGITIDSTAITSGTAQRVLFESATNKVTESGEFTYTPSPTTGSGLAIAASTVTSGNLVSIAASGTAAASNTKTALNVATSGANGTSTQTTYAAQFSNTSTGTSSTNVALGLSASGGTNNYAISVSSGLIIAAAGTTTAPGLVGGSSLTTGLNWQNSGQLGLTTNGTERLRINAFGIDIGAQNITAGSGFAGNDTIFRRAGAANWQFGATDAASPVAQTLSVQNVVAGTSNTAGVDWTFNFSRGTGTGAGGNGIFRGAPAGTSGTSQNALSEAFRINNYGGGRPKSVTFANLPGSPTDGDFIFCSDCAPTSAFVNQTCTSGGSGSMAFRVNGAWKCYN